MAVFLLPDTEEMSPLAPCAGHHEASGQLSPLIVKGDCLESAEILYGNSSSWTSMLVRTKRISQNKNRLEDP
ncbi:hypothetical protein BP5796_08916 [Coleophoma crateriformis]|uniref:Uncharacterized protein n=1 Tax=Coleophoma crateriformis TaxID=565419 RepID=A0A3D8R2J7_9HELO|nr:hypothetical protein BP5796_08916 [Coleophoma crateriformis]